MLGKLYRRYKIFFDEKLGNGTSIVALIALIVIAVGVCQSCSLSTHGKANLLEINTINQEPNIVYIDGSAYEITLNKIK
ncbi:MAG: hypothetical protein GY828_05975 [Candidatus Gracilibacteria bacterium]|nr:hypothetical protein [Candidatus Gracilibacteria bacterium]